MESGTAALNHTVNVMPNSGKFWFIYKARRTRRGSCASIFVGVVVIKLCIKFQGSRLVTRYLGAGGLLTSLFGTCETPATADKRQKALDSDVFVTVGKELAS